MGEKWVVTPRIEYKSGHEGWGNHPWEIPSLLKSIKGIFFVFHTGIKY